MEDKGYPTVQNPYKYLQILTNTFKKMCQEINVSSCSYLFSAIGFELKLINH